ncbi:hypothetical protein B7494_g7266 [Chlorociboria aeruginascens]|nr:hypothetical protein B7494_g7266 [Chlorociboria aeruginascens]
MSLPPSSPRLPSPPPPTEIQIGPKSPSAGGGGSQESAFEQSVIDANSSRRIHPGTRSADMAAGPPLIPLGELDSAFQLQEHLKALHYHYTKPEGSDNTGPITRDTALLIATQPEGLERTLWLYELCRFLINKCNDLIIGFLFDDPPCSATTCPEMRASEWQFLCAVHEPPKSCCAIDYCCHTLDWATNIVTSQKIFPSRLSLGAGDAVDDRGAAVKHLVNIFRRLHRIFAHAWFQHRGVFWQVEGQTGLYVLFKTVCDNYELLPAENYKLPPEAEGLEPIEEGKPAVPSILKSNAGLNHTASLEEEFLGPSRTNTRRHIRQSPSVGSAVTTVLEADEEDPGVTQRPADLQITEEEGEAEVPVIVENFDTEGPQEIAAVDSEAGVAAHGDSPIAAHEDVHTDSSTSSWEKVTAEPLEDKPATANPTEVESTEPVRDVPEEAESEATTETEIKQEPEVEEDAHVKGEVQEEKKPDES